MKVGGVTTVMVTVWVTLEFAFDLTVRLTVRGEVIVICGAVYVTDVTVLFVSEPQSPSAVSFLVGAQVVLVLSDQFTPRLFRSLPTVTLKLMG